jgi:hypothetical protein
MACRAFERLRGHRDECAEMAERMARPIDVESEVRTRHVDSAAKRVHRCEHGT